MPDRGAAKLDELARWVGEARRKRDRDRRMVKAKRLASELAQGGDVAAMDLWAVALDPGKGEVSAAAAHALDHRHAECEIAVAASEALGDRHLVARLSQECAQAYGWSVRSEAPLFLAWTRRAHREYAALGMDREAGHAAFNLGLLHEWYDMWALWKRPFEKIVRCFREADDRFTRAGMRKEALAVRWWLTDIRFSGQLPPRKAIRLLMQLVKELPGVDMGYEVPHILLNLAYVHRRAGDRQRANLLAERAYREAEVWGEFAYVERASELLGNWAVEDGLFARADR